MKDDNNQTPQTDSNVVNQNFSDNSSSTTNNNQPGDVSSPSTPPLNNDSPITTFNSSELNTPEDNDIKTKNSTINPESIITSPHTPKKYGGSKVIATIFGILLLLGGVTAGVILVQRQQQISERAASGKECSQSSSCILLDEPGNTGTFTAPQTISQVWITDKDVYKFDPGESDDGCHKVKIDNNFLTWEKYGPGPSCKDVSNVQVWLGTTTVTSTPTSTQIPTNPCKYCENNKCKTSTSECSTELNKCQTDQDCIKATATPSPEVTLSPTSSPEISAKCSEVKTYDSEWNPLTSNDLNNLKTGDKIRFTVSATTTSGSFDKARFKVNSNDLGETNKKKPGTNDFYIEYILAEGVTSFTVTAQIHHTELGWF